MTVRHHPDDELLFDYATGRLEAPLSLIVATHWALCSRCKAITSTHETMGGLLLENLAPAGMSPDALSKTLSRLQSTPMEGAVASQGGMPGPLRSFLGRELDQLKWRKMGSGLQYYRLYRDEEFIVALTRVSAMGELGLHSHTGQEFTQTLMGGYADETGQYGPGDFQTASPEILHNPRADEGGECVTLTVTRGRPKFR